MDTLKVDCWEERDRLHISLSFGDHQIADWWDGDARQMFEDGFFRSGRDLESSVIAYAADHGLLRHYVYGSGQHGCLYDNGPNFAWVYTDAVDDLAEMFELGRTRKAELRRSSFLELDPRTGAEYCEIQECECLHPEEHIDE